MWRAFDYYVGAGDVGQAVAIAEFPDYSLAWTSVVEELIPRALAMVPPDSHEAGRLLCRHGQRLGVGGGDYEGAQVALGRALDIAVREGDTALELRILVDAASVDSHHMRWQEVVEKTSIAIQLAQRADDLRTEVSARYFAITALTSVGDLAEVRRHGSAMLAPAERLRDRFWLSGALWKNGIGFRLAGDWETARDFNDRALAGLGTRASVLADRVMLECEVGDLDQSRAFLEQFLVAPMAGAVTPGYVAILMPLFARITGGVSHLDLAKEAAEGILSSDSSNPNALSRARAGLGLQAVLENDGVGALAQYAALESARGTMLWWMISGGRLLGLLAQTIGKPDDSVVHFEDALTFCRKAGYRPELAWTCCDYAGTLLERKGRDDNGRAVVLLDESLAISTQLGMRPLIERVVALQELAESQPTRAPAYPDGLTQREVEVLRLIASGKTNRQIGEELFISLNTAGHHVSNILSKTGSANRAEVATYAAQHGLTQ